jgi:hypothetical protein
VIDKARRDRQLDRDEIVTDRARRLTLQPIGLT